MWIFLIVSIHDNQNYFPTSVIHSFAGKKVQGLKLFYINILSWLFSMFFYIVLSAVLNDFITDI